MKTTTRNTNTMIIELDDNDDVRLVFNYLVDFIRNVRGMFRIKNLIVDVSKLNSNNRRIIYQIHNNISCDDWVERCITITKDSLKP